MSTTNTKQTHRTSKYQVVDSSAINQKIEDEKNKKSSSDKYILKLENPKKQNDVNSAIVRILPYPPFAKTGGGFYIETFFHYNVGTEKVVACPKGNNSEPCAICDYVYKLYGEAQKLARKNNIDPSNKDAMRANDQIADLWEQARELRHTQRNYFPVLVVSINDQVPTEDQAGVRFFGVSKTLGDKLLTALGKKRKHNPLDLLEGYQFNFTCKNTGKSFNGRAYGEIDFEILTDEDTSPILPSGDIDEIDTLIDSVPNIWETLLKARTSEEVARLMGEIEDDNKASISSPITESNGRATEPIGKYNIDEELKSDIEESLGEVGDLDELL